MEIVLALAMTLGLLGSVFFLQPVSTGHSIDLPATPQVAAVPSASLSVYLSREGEVFFEGNPVSGEELLQRLAEVDQADRKTIRILLMADQTVEYATVIGVMSQITKAGFNDIALVSSNKNGD